MPDRDEFTGQLTGALPRLGQGDAQPGTSSRAQEQNPDKHTHAQKPYLNTRTRAHQQAYKECVRERPFSGVNEHQQSHLSPRSAPGVRYSGTLWPAYRSAATCIFVTPLIGCAVTAGDLRRDPGLIVASLASRPPITVYWDGMPI
jgi:hypothetical protein